ncbi:hypothetical protein [Porticoccus sp.]
MMYDAMWAGHWVWMLLIGIVVVVPVWRICLRTGLPGWLSILMLVPFVNLGLLYFIAFATWPKDTKTSDTKNS